MTQSEEQQFLTDLEKKLWNAADKLRSTLDAAQYKHTVLGLVNHPGYSGGCLV